ncbi:MAG: sugar ABC transporter ATP-binding protein, partial [Maritimibacter sp.]
MADTLLHMQSITKTFPGVRALDGVDLFVRAGEIHGLVGENGAGKSTIIKVLAGVYQADSGRVYIEGKTLESVTPAAVHAAGVRFIHQELHLVQHFTVTESVFMGQEISGPTGLLRREMQTRAEAFFREALGAEISGNTLIRDLGIAERKLVQIARALIDGQAKLVVFDEPTAPLSSSETERLFAAITRLQERGIAMIYVSHYLAEITEICERVTVLRNGQNVTVFEEVLPDSADAMISAMVGRDIDALFSEGRQTPGDEVLTLEGLTHDKFTGVDLTVHKGEIIGIAGLIGSGREELVDVIYGLKHAKAGRVSLDGVPTRLHAPADAVAAGIVLVPRDRRHDGLVLGMSASDNVNLASLDDISTALIERRKAGRARAEETAEQLDIRPRNVAAMARNLSGGNQQKLVLGRWLTKGARLFILDEPTVGVDVGAKVEIYALVKQLAADGAAVIVSSGDPVELVGLCDRIKVMLRGEIVADIETDGLGVDQLVALTTGGQAA